jgi:superfamily I DNA/RNA helicase
MLIVGRHGRIGERTEPLTLEGFGDGTIDVQKKLWVFGPPGTGKTKFLSSVVEQLVEKTGDDTSVVALSFTRAAAHELTDRMSLPKENAGTIASILWNAFERPEMAEGHLPEFNEQYPEFALDCEDSSSVAEGILHGSIAAQGDELQYRYNFNRETGIPRKQWSAEVQVFASRWESWRDGKGYMDFPQLVERGLKELPSCPGDPDYIVSDETQDNTASENRLIDQWGEKTKMLVKASDEDQCIYLFRGASPEKITEENAPLESRIFLRQSYRVPREVVDYSQKWIGQIKDRLPKAYAPRKEEGQVVEGEVRTINQLFTWRSPDNVLRDAEQYLNKGKSVMFLTSCSYMLHPLISELRKEGLPFHNPYNLKHHSWNPLQEHKEGIITSKERLLSYIAPLTKDRFWNTAEAYEWMDIIASKGILADGAKTVLKNAIDSKTEMNEEQLTDLFIDRGVLKEAYDGAFSNALLWFDKHILPSKRKGIDFPLAIFREHGVKPLTEQPQIIVGTIHSVKGGQADVVYLFPDLSRAGEHEWMGTEIQRNNIIRQYYVGMTRAKESLVLPFPAGKEHVNIHERW